MADQCITLSHNTFNWFIVTMIRFPCILSRTVFIQPWQQTASAKRQPLAHLVAGNACLPPGVGTVAKRRPVQAILHLHPNQWAMCLTIRPPSFLLFALQPSITLIDRFANRIPVIGREFFRQWVKLF